MLCCDVPIDRNSCFKLSGRSTAGVARVHCGEDADVRVKPALRPDQLDGRLVPQQPRLDGQNLLRHRGEDAPRGG